MIWCFCWYAVHNNISHDILLLLLIGLQWLHTTNISFISFFNNRLQTWDYLFSSYHKMATQVEWPLSYMAYIHLLFFCHPSHDVRTMMATAIMPTFSLFLFSWTGKSFCSAHLVIQWELQFVSYFGYPLTFASITGMGILCPVVLTLDSYEFSFVDSCASCLSEF